MANRYTDRPWGISKDYYDYCMKLFPIWLRERKGVVVYQNRMMGSSRLGDTTFTPARFYAEGDTQLHDAPMRLGDVPSRLQEKVDHITLEEFGGELDKALACFCKAVGAPQ